VQRFRCERQVLAYLTKVVFQQLYCPTTLVVNYLSCCTPLFKGRT
jgi:hypothetical protein